MKTLLFNGNIRTLDNNNSIFNSILFDEHSIIEIGNNIDLKLKYSTDLEFIDLKGRTVLPGFIDCHNHLLCYSTAKLGIDFYSSNIKNITQLLNAIALKGQMLKEGTWLKVANFDENLLEEKRRPTIEELDSVSRAFPLVILRKCLHEAIANSVALKLSNIDSNTPEPYGGIIEKRLNGEKLTGVLKDSAMDILKMSMEPYSVEDLTEALDLGYQEILSEGITTVHETGVGLMQSLHDEMGAYQLAYKNNKLKVRTRLYLLSQGLKNDISMLGIREGFGSDMLNIAGVKFFQDGAFSIHTAGLLEPYANAQNTCGSILYSKDELKALYLNCHINGLQTSTHAIGDNAIEYVIQCFEEIKSEYGWNDMRHRIEHFTLGNDAQMKRVKKCGIVIMSNPSEIYFYGDSMVNNFGLERASRSYPLKSMIKNDLLIASGSDRPCGEGNPLITIQAAIERTTRDGIDLSGNESVTIDEMIKIWTKGSAYCEFSEKKKGTLELGKMSDIVVFEEDPYKVKTSEIASIKVDYTFVGGELNFNR